jgi:hypothetical protein
MHHPAQVDHARHDTALIAGHAAGDLTNLDTAAAATLLDACSDCAELHRDLVAIAAATRALPHDARAPRDFRIGAEQAERLHRGSWLRGLLRPFASARSAARPMAAAFTSVGVAGLLVATVVPALLGGAAAPVGGASAQGPAATVAPVAAPANPEAGDPGAAAASGDVTYVRQGEDSGMEVAVDGGFNEGIRDEVLTSGGKGSDERRSIAESPNLLVLGSIGLLFVGLALFGLRLAARRLR